MIKRQSPVTTTDGVSLASFGEVSLSCNSYGMSNGLSPHYCSHIGAYTAQANSNFDLGSPAIVFRNVKLAVSFYGNPLYPSANVIDFVICFRTFNPYMQTSQFNT